MCDHEKAHLQLGVACPAGAGKIMHGLRDNHIGQRSP